MTVEERLKQLEAATALEVLALIEPPMCWINDDGALEFNKEAMLALDAHVVLSSDEVPRGEKIFTVNTYGKNRVGIGANPSEELLLVVTNQDEISGIKTASLSKSTKMARSTISAPFLGIISKVFHPDILISSSDRFLIKDIVKDETTSICVLELKGSESKSKGIDMDFGQDDDSSTTPDLDVYGLDDAIFSEPERTKTTASMIEDIAKEQAALEPIELVSYHEMPSLPE